MEQIQRIVTEVMEHPKIKRLTAEEKENLSFTISRYVKRVLLQIKSHCNREDVPEALESVAAQITEDMLLADGVIKYDKDIASVSRGDTSISYQDSTSTFNNAVDFMKNYSCQLVHFKKMKLPKDPLDERS